MNIKGANQIAGLRLEPDQKVLAAIGGIWCTVAALNTQFSVAGSQDVTNAFCLLLLLLPLFTLGQTRGLKKGLRLFAVTNNGKALLAWAFVACAAWSAATSGAPLRSFGYISAAVVGFIAFGELYSRLGVGFGWLLRVYSIVGTVAIAIMLLLRELSGINEARLSLGVGDHPNHFGLVCWSILCAALAWENILVKTGLAALMLLFMSRAESRTALVAAAASLVIYPAFRYRQLWQRVLLPSVSAILLLLAISVRGPDALLEAGSSLLMLNDKYRGTESGLAGRADQWPVALDLISEKPLLGHGYHVQEQYLPTQDLLRVGGFHNGYIGLVVEIGFLGAIPLFCLIGLATFSLWGKARLSDSYAVELSLVVGYLVYATAQPYLINQTNPASALFWCVVCGALVGKERRNRGLVLTQRLTRYDPGGRGSAERRVPVLSGGSELRSKGLL